jgi:PEGA domain
MSFSAVWIRARSLCVVSTLAVALVAAGCSHTVVIDSDPQGAQVKVNGEVLGSTPVTYTEQTGWEKVYDLEVSKPGYKTVKTKMRQSEFHVPMTAATVVGFLLCLLPAVGILWSKQLPDRVVVDMDKSNGAAGGESGELPPAAYGY